MNLNPDISPERWRRIVDQVDKLRELMGRNIEKGKEKNKQREFIQTICEKKDANRESE